MESKLDQEDPTVINTFQYSRSAAEEDDIYSQKHALLKQSALKRHIKRRKGEDQPTPCCCFFGRRGAKKKGSVEEATGYTMID